MLARAFEAARTCPVDGKEIIRWHGGGYRNEHTMGLAREGGSIIERGILRGEANMTPTCLAAFALAPVEGVATLEQMPAVSS